MRVQSPGTGASFPQETEGLAAATATAYSVARRFRRQSCRCTVRTSAIPRRASKARLFFGGGCSQAIRRAKRGGGTDGEDAGARGVVSPGGDFRPAVRRLKAGLAGAVGVNPGTRLALGMGMQHKSGADRKVDKGRERINGGHAPTLQSIQRGLPNESSQFVPSLMANHKV